MLKLHTLAAVLLTPGMSLAAPAITRALARPQGSIETRNERIVTRAFARWAAGGTNFFHELLAPDVTWTIKGSGPSAGVYRGRREFLDRAVTPFGSRLSRPVRPTVRDIWSKGDKVVVHWDGEGMARDGVAYRNSYVWIFRMRDGRVAEATAFLDLVPYDNVLRRIAAH